MQYQESLFIDKEGNEQMIIKLFDLQWMLLVDYASAPNIIQVIDMNDNRVLHKVRYGDGDSLEGFSFAVSPFHNYLVVKEAAYGQSSDDLYASIYCLRDLASLPLQNTTGNPVATIPMFSSHRHLTFMFSSDSEEQMLWVAGQQSGDLELLDEYQFHQSAQPSNDDSLPQAQFFKVASYPYVKLDPRIRDGNSTEYLTPSLVVNDLTRIEREARQQQFAFRLHKEYQELLTSLVANFDAQQPSDTSQLRFVQTCVSNDKPLVNKMGFERALQQLNLTYVVMFNESEEGGRYYWYIEQPMLSDPAYLLQSVVLLNELCGRHGLVYEGVQLSADAPPKGWQEAMFFSLGGYIAYCSSFLSDNINNDSFIQLVSDLMAKHRYFNFNEFYSESAYDFVESLRLAFNQFDDWEIKEPELRQKVVSAIKTFDPLKGASAASS